MNRLWMKCLVALDNWTWRRTRAALQRERLRRLREQSMGEKMDLLWMKCLAWLFDWALRQHQLAHGRCQARWLRRELEELGWRCEPHGQKEKRKAESGKSETECDTAAE